MRNLEMERENLIHDWSRVSIGEDSDRNIGTVKWFNPAKGYGFTGLNGGDDVFVHISAIKMDGYRRFSKDQEVEFSIEEGPKGLQPAGVVAFVQSKEKN